MGQFDKGNKPHSGGSNQDKERRYQFSGQGIMKNDPVHKDRQQRNPVDDPDTEEKPRYS